MRLRSRTPPRARRPSSGLIQNATPTIMPIVPTATFLSNGRVMVVLLTFSHARAHLITLSRSALFTTSLPLGTFWGTIWPYLYPKDEDDDQDDWESCEPVRSVRGEQVASQEKHQREHAEPQPLKACGPELWSEAPCKQAKHKANEQHSES
jgi:hypothetical protein